MYSWGEFIKGISNLYIEGKSESDISGIYAGSKISGIGRIARVKPDDKYPGFIQVFMPRIEVPFKGMIIIGEFLALNFESLNKNNIKSLKKGSTLQFTTQICQPNGPFLSIKIAEYESDKEIHIMPFTGNTKIA